MHIIICGTGQVAVSIAGHMALENDVTIVDVNAEKVQRITETRDVRGVIGVPSHPDILEKAGAKNADMVIAVTESDEINMIACQVAYTIFNTPLKIARIRARSYMDPMVGDLYSPENLPIDHIISPEVEVSAAVGSRLQVPGAFDVEAMVGGAVRLVGVRCMDNCPILNSPLRHLTDLFDGLNITVVAILRGSEVILARDGSGAMMEGDRVYFVCDDEHMSRAMASFGHEEPASRNVLIAGAGTVGKMVAQGVVSNIEQSRCTVIEFDKETANEAAHMLSGNTIINGDALEAEILEEAGVADADTFVALTDDDEVNVLSSLLSKTYGATHTVTLVNMASFVPLISNLGVDSVINPPAITVATILRHSRSGKVNDIHTIVEDKGEFIELEAMSASPLVGVPLRSAKLPKRIAVGAVVRDGTVIPPRGDTTVEPGDRVVLFAAREAVAEVQKLLSVKPEFF